MYGWMNCVIYERRRKDWLDVWFTMKMKKVMKEYKK